MAEDTSIIVTEELPTDLSEYDVKPFTKVLRLINSNATRWNSVLAMIVRLLILKEPIM